MSPNPNGDPNDLNRNKSADEMNPNDSATQINSKVLLLHTLAETRTSKA